MMRATCAAHRLSDIGDADDGADAAEIRLGIERLQVFLVHVELLGEHLGDRGVAQPVELGLLAIVRRHRGDERARGVAGRDGVAGEGIAAARGQGRLDAFRIGRLQVFAGDLAIGDDRLVDIRAEMAVDDAGRGAARGRAAPEVPPHPRGRRRRPAARWRLRRSSGRYRLQARRRAARARPGRASRFPVPLPAGRGSRGAAPPESHSRLGRSRAARLHIPRSAGRCDNGRRDRASAAPYPRDRRDSSGSPDAAPHAAPGGGRGAARRGAAARCREPRRYRRRQARGGRTGRSRFRPRPIGRAAIRRRAPRATAGRA